VAAGWGHAPRSAFSRDGSAFQGQQKIQGRGYVNMGAFLKQMHQKIKYIPMKIYKIVTIRPAHFGQDKHQIVCWLIELRPRPTALSQTPSCIKRAYFYGRGGDGRRGAAISTVAWGGTNARASTGLVYNIMHTAQGKLRKVLRNASNIMSKTGLARK